MTNNSIVVPSRPACVGAVLGGYLIAALASFVLGFMLMAMVV